MGMEKVDRLIRKIKISFEKFVRFRARCSDVFYVPFYLIALLFFSGPKRYDFVEDAWVYSHEQDRTLHDLLTDELSKALNKDVDFSQLNHAKRTT